MGLSLENVSHLEDLFMDKDMVKVVLKDLLHIHSKSILRVLHLLGYIFEDLLSRKGCSKNDWIVYR
jgi:hypothetical protein